MAPAAGASVSRTGCPVRAPVTATSSSWAGIVANTSAAAARYTDCERGAVGGDCEHDDLDALRLRFFDRLREVVITRDEVDHINRAVSRVTDHVEADAEVDAFLFAFDADAAESGIRLRHQRDLLLLPRQLPVARSVVPMGAK